MPKLGATEQSVPHHDQDPQPQYQVEEAVNPADIQAAKDLLYTILYEPFGMEFHTDHDAAEDIRYVVARNGQEIIGAGRLCLNPDEAETRTSGIWDALQLQGYTLEQLRGNMAWFYGIAVKPEYRSQKVGSLLYEARHQMAVAHGKTIFGSLIRVDSWPLYFNRGYHEFGELTTNVSKNRAMLRKWVWKAEVPPAIPKEQAVSMYLDAATASFNQASEADSYGRVDWTQQEAEKAINAQKVETVPIEWLLVHPVLAARVREHQVQPYSFTVLRIDSNQLFIRRELLPIKRLNQMQSRWVSINKEMLNELTEELGTPIATLKIIATIMAWEESTGYKIKNTGWVGK